MQPGIHPGRVVVVGAGVAGTRVVRRLRNRGYQGAISLLDAQAELPYDRPPLSKAVLRGERDLPVILDAVALAALDIDWRPSRRAVGLDAAGHRVLLESGDSLGYDVLVVATGAQPRRLPGLDGEVLRTWADAERLRAAVRPGLSVVVVGAGLIGCEVASSLRFRGVSVHLVDPQPVPMVRVLGPVVAREVVELHREAGVGLHLGTTVTRRDAAGVTLAGGAYLAADLVLEAVGIRPEVGWLESSDARLADGVHCDEQQRTASADVYAVGDVAAPQGRRAEHWSAANEQADRAVAAILGLPMPPPEPAYWWSDQHGVKLQGLGRPDPTDEVVIGDAGNGRLALFGEAGRLVGAVGIGAPGPLMKTRSAIVEGTSLSVVSDALLSTPKAQATA